MKTKDVRKILTTAMEKAADGALSAEDGRNIIGLANQISHSMAVEIKALAMKERLGQKSETFGHLKVDE